MGVPGVGMPVVLAHLVSQQGDQEVTQLRQCGADVDDAEWSGTDGDTGLYDRTSDWCGCFCDVHGTCSAVKRAATQGWQVAGCVHEYVGNNVCPSRFSHNHVVLPLLAKASRWLAVCIFALMNLDSDHIHSRACDADVVLQTPSGLNGCGADEGTTP